MRWTTGLIAIVAVIVLAIVMALAGQAQDLEAQEQANTNNDAASGERTMATETATFGAGCFWAVEETFRCTPGVTDTEVGYAGGHTESPTYEQVCTHTTGHAEVVQVQFDPEQVTYEELLRVFFEAHDPTQMNRQGPDVGDQYRSVIFYHSEEQKQAAEKLKAELGESGRYRRPIATLIEQAPTFWPAEDYHQEYLRKRGRGG